MLVIALIIVFMLDVIIGDPYHWPHPVKLIGNFISFTLSLLGKIPLSKYIKGLVLWLVIVIVTLALVGFLLELTKNLSPILFWLLWIYLAYTTLATRSLSVEAMKVYRVLLTDDIQTARQQVAMIVGRDTSELTREEICKATIETVAENTSDGVIGPLFYLLMGGPVLAMAYKAVNTLDSMVGYKTKKYRQIGFVSAKMDDLLNLIPARLTWFYLLVASHILQLDVKKAIHIGVRDCYQHASPNSGFPESVVAGALGIQLGGSHVYHGELIEKPTIGDKDKEVEPAHILTTIYLLYISSFLALVTGLVVYSFIILF